MGTVKKQKRARKGALKNRYYAGAKLSEHKFLRILLGFSEGLSIATLERTTRVSGKTIRTTYRALRQRLPQAAEMEPDRFGGAGRLLSHNALSTLLHAVRRSRYYLHHRRRQAPRLTCPDEALEHVNEIAVRLMCALDLRETGLHEDEKAVREIILRLADAAPRLNRRESLHKLAQFLPGAKPFAYHEFRFYEDYRQCLLKNPLGTQ